MTRISILLLCLLFALSGCGRTDSPAPAIPLPAEPSAPIATPVREPVLVRVDPHGGIEFRDVPASQVWEPIASGTLLRKLLRTAAARAPNRSVIVFAAPDTPWERLSYPFSALRSAGFPAVTVALADDRQLVVPFPGANVTAEAFSSKALLTVQVGADGLISLDHRLPADPTEVDMSALRNAAARNPQPLVLLCVDDAATFETVVRTFALCNSAGLRHVLLRPLHSCGALATALPPASETAPATDLPRLRTAVGEMQAILARLKSLRKARAAHALQALTIDGKIAQESESDKQAVELMKKIVKTEDIRAPYADIHSASAWRIHNQAAVAYLTVADIYGEIRAIEHFRSNRGSIPVAFQLHDKITPVHRPHEGDSLRHIVPDVDTMLRDTRRLAQLNDDRLGKEASIPTDLCSFDFPQQLGADIFTGERPFLFPGTSVPSTNVSIGWMHIDEWHIVGPFPNPGRKNARKAFPPESSADLGAEYIGKNGEPIRWVYVHSNVAPILPPNQSEYSVWYAYSEIHSVKDRDVWICIGCNDYGKVWVNGDLVKATGLTPVADYLFDRKYAKVHLKAGANPVLFRVENCWGGCAFSIIIYCGAVPTS